MEDGGRKGARGGRTGAGTGGRGSLAATRCCVHACGSFLTPPRRREWFVCALKRPRLFEHASVLFGGREGGTVWQPVAGASVSFRQGLVCTGGAVNTCALHHCWRIQVQCVGLCVGLLKGHKARGPRGAGGEGLACSASGVNRANGKGPWVRGPGGCKKRSGRGRGTGTADWEGGAAWQCDTRVSFAECVCELHRATPSDVPSDTGWRCGSAAGCCWRRAAGGAGPQLNSSGCCLVVRVCAWFVPGN